ncbi:hypothetical protein [Leptolyngbya sp. FACHB-261]|uniref:hypothetical protein n=1 Tax=Leptolyngbya sp. FACHB-261 TaxID=2692806 RepID=UPI0016867C6D|nr:hypothetical protein [Leptolyngbya sp. FACHB-261]
MNSNTWHKIWKFLNQPLFVKQPNSAERPDWQQIQYLERCWLRTVSDPKTKQ